MKLLIIKTKHQNFYQYNIPMPKSIEYHRNINDNNNFISVINKKLNYPLVVKPVGEYQSIDVFININNEVELKEIINKLKQKYDELKIEEQVYGKLYRILIINNKIIDILERPLPYVIEMEMIKSKI